MKEKWKDCRRWIQSHFHASVIAGCMIMALVIVAAGFIFTKDKTQSRAQDKLPEKVQVENAGCTEEETNPLELETHPEVSSAVRDYYNRLAEDTGFAEGYNNVQVYTKAGKYKDSYVVFARYDMKIKDIYTEVPGLGTLYAEKNQKSGAYDLKSDGLEPEIQEYVTLIAGHTDVQELMSQIQTDYANAVASDALLQESLQDLKNAYENQ